MDLQNLSSNWKKLQVTLNQNKSTQPVQNSHGLKRKRDETGATASTQNHQISNRKRARISKKMSDGIQNAPNGNLSKNLSKRTQHNQNGISNIQNLENAPNPDRPAHLSSSSYKDTVNAGLSPNVEIGRYIALDCEMVGIGPDPTRESALARVSVVNYNGEQIYDSYVRPLETVTDWRTHVSGIAPKHMIHARSLEQVQKDVAGILTGKVVVGHSIRNDLEALLLSHPKRDIRDTARHPAYRKLAGGSSPRLKILASELLGWRIQEGEHSSVEDARACMMLFRRDKAAFEREHAKKWPVKPVVEKTEDGNGEAEVVKKKKHKKKKKKR